MTIEQMSEGRAILDQINECKRTIDQFKSAVFLDFYMKEETCSKICEIVTNDLQQEIKDLTEKFNSL